MEPGSPLKARCVDQVGRQDGRHTGTPPRRGGACCSKVRQRPTNSILEHDTPHLIGDDALTSASHSQPSFTGHTHLAGQSELTLLSTARPAPRSALPLHHSPSPASLQPGTYRYSRTQSGCSSSPSPRGGLWNLLHSFVLAPWREVRVGGEGGGRVVEKPLEKGTGLDAAAILAVNGGKLAGDQVEDRAETTLVARECDRQQVMSTFAPVWLVGLSAKWLRAVHRSRPWLSLGGQWPSVVLTGV